MNSKGARERENGEMKLRLRGGGEDSLFEWMRKQNRSMAWLARQADMTRAGVDRIVKGQTRRPTTESLEKIAEALGLKIGGDADGFYYEYSEDGEMADTDGLVDMLHDGLARMVRALSPEQKKLVEEIVDVVTTPDDRDILVLLIDVLKLRRKRKLM